MLHTQFQASEPSGSEEEDFFKIFFVFLWLEPRSPGQRSSWIPGPSFETNLVEVH